MKEFCTATRRPRSVLATAEMRRTQKVPACHGIDLAASHSGPRVRLLLAGWRSDTVVAFVDARVLLGTAGVDGDAARRRRHSGLLLVATALLLPSAGAACGCCRLHVPQGAPGRVRRPRRRGQHHRRRADAHHADGTVLEDRTGPWDGGAITANDGTVYAARISGTGPWNFSANATRPKYSADLSALAARCLPLCLLPLRDLTDGRLARASPPISVPPLPAAG